MLSRYCAAGPGGHRPELHHPQRDRKHGHQRPGRRGGQRKVAANTAA